MTSRPNINRARTLRRDGSEVERVLWRHLRGRQFSRYKFRRQHTLGPYVLDFVCLSARLVIELDGGQHADKVAYDVARTAWLEKQGFRVLNFSNPSVFTESEGVLETILVALQQPPHPGPLPTGERERSVRDEC